MIDDLLSANWASHKQIRLQPNEKGASIWSDAERDSFQSAGAYTINADGSAKVLRDDFSKKWMASQWYLPTITLAIFIKVLPLHCVKKIPNGLCLSNRIC